MTQFRRLAILPVLFFFLPSAAALADHIYVAPATGTGVSGDDLATATDLVRTSISEVTPNNDVVSQAGDADFVLQPKLVRLGQAYILSITKMRNGEALNSTQLKAERMDELDKVATRVTRSILANTRASSTPRVGEITDQEAKEGTQRRPVRKTVYLGFGGATLRNLNTTGIGYSLGAAYSWDLNTVRVKLMGEGDVNGSAFFANGALGANYYLGLEDVAPYVSADFGGGVAKIDQSVFSGQTVGGFIVGIGAGVEFLRTSAVNLDLGFRAAFLLHQNSMGAPEALTLRLGLYF